ncbi:hypothetical protein NLC30_03400 [Candidatus Aminicenantes bacterium AC-334-E05]|nr:hypothetical protein [Candidatus Aminicenantes bacterium AC-334-E05]
MFEILYSLERETAKNELGPSIGVEPCIKLYYGFIVPCWYCIVTGGCSAA